MSEDLQESAAKQAVTKGSRRRPQQGPVDELLRSMSPSEVATADRFTYTEFLFMTRRMTVHDAANLFHALSIPISNEFCLVCHNTAAFFQAVCIQYLDPALVAEELLQMGPPHFTFPFWDCSAFAHLLIAWQHGFEEDFPIDIVLEILWNYESEKFNFLKQMCMAIPCVSTLGMWQQSPGRIAAYDGEEEAAKEYPQFLRPAILRALDDAYPLHADEVEELLREPVAKYPNSLILAAAASGRNPMATEQILGSLAYVMASHPLPQALPFLQQVFDEDSDAILVTFYILFREVDPDIIKQSFRICQALNALPLIVGTLQPMISFWFLAIAVDSALLETAIFSRYLKKELADINSENLLRTIRSFLDFQVMGIQSMQWTEESRDALFDALPKLPALLSSVPRLPALFSLSHGASTRPAVPLLNSLSPLNMESFAAALWEKRCEKEDQEFWKWRDNPFQMKYYLVCEYNENGSLEFQKTILNSGDAESRVAKLSVQQRERIYEIMATIDCADEARKAGYSNQEIWLLYKVQLT